jgi:MFS family permease
MELRRRHPLLDVGLLRKRTLRGIVLAMFAAQFIVNGYLIYVATYFQHVLGFGPLLAALAIVPSMLTQPLFNILAGRATDRIGPRAPAMAGYALTVVAFAWIAFFVDDDSYALLLPGLLVLGASIAPMFTSLLTGLSNAVAAEERGDANALVLTVRWIGAAAGTMVLGVVVYSGGEATPTASPYETAFTILACVALAGGLACFFLLRDREPEARPERHHFRPHF